MKSAVKRAIAGTLIAMNTALVTLGCATKDRDSYNSFIPEIAQEEYSPQEHKKANNAILWYEKASLDNVIDESELQDLETITGISENYKNKKQKAISLTDLASQITPNPDVNQDGKTNIFDLLAWLKIFSNKQEYDVNQDGKTNIFDLLTLLQVMSGNYGKTTFQGNIKEMFSKEAIPRAIVQVLNPNEEIITADTTDNAYYKVKFDTSDNEYRLRISADDFFTHVTSKILADKSKTMNQTLVPESFNMQAFDEGYRSIGYNFKNATNRWKTPAEGGIQPKDYIDLLDIYEGEYSDYYIPYIPVYKKLWTDVINETAETGRQAEHVLFSDSVDIEFGTNAPALDTDGYIIYDYLYSPGWTGWIFNNNEIKNVAGSVTKATLDTTITRAIYAHEKLRAIGFTGYIPDSQPSVGNTPAHLPHLNNFDRNSVIFLYSRPWGSKTPDTNP